MMVVELSNRYSDSILHNNNESNHIARKNKWFHATNELILNARLELAICLFDYKFGEVERRMSSTSLGKKKTYLFFFW